MNHGFKQVGIVTICSRINVAKVILEEGSEVGVIQCYGSPMLLYGMLVRGDTISIGARNEIEKVEKMFLHRQLWIKSSTSYPILLLETCASPIEVLAM